ncbi:LOW QUALITY PROTEIN: hypothetical protein M8C21_013917, partial [Ambrosia artemisiifolia]
VFSLNMEFIVVSLWRHVKRLDMELLERISLFGSASSSPSLASLPPIRVHVDDGQKVGGIKEQFGQMSKVRVVQDDVACVAAVPPVVVAICYRCAGEFYSGCGGSAGFDLASSHSVSRHVIYRGAMHSKHSLGVYWLDVYADGSICLDILQNQWSPTYDVAAILTSIQ